MYVGFDKLYGKDSFVIAPSGYNAYYCHGKCDGPFGGPNATNHAFFQGIMSTITGAKTISSPCCAPTSLRPVKVFYFDDKGKEQIKEMKNMIVEACGCQ